MPKAATKITAGIFGLVMFVGAMIAYEEITDVTKEREARVMNERIMRNLAKTGQSFCHFSVPK